MNTLLQTQKQEIQNADGIEVDPGPAYQSEKMASLGELTAGIAHEIQNPLNFVNNFSEVNKELVGEMKEELDKGNLAEAKAIAEDIETNEDKIYFTRKTCGFYCKRYSTLIQGNQRSRKNPLISMHWQTSTYVYPIRVSALRINPLMPH